MQSRLAVSLALVLGGCSAVLDTGIAQCEVDADCAALQLGARCMESKTCQPLTTGACREVWPASALTDPDALFVGFMAATSGSGQSYGLPQLAGAKQALSELESQYGGLPAVPTQGLPKRRLAMLICDQAEWEAATEHLVKNLKLPAIVGASYSGVTRNVFERAQSFGRPTLVFSPAATSPTLTDQQDDGLLWRTPPTDTLQTEAIKLVYARLAAALTTPASTSTPPAVASPQSIKVAVTIKGETAGNALFDALQQRAAPDKAVDPAPPIPVSLNPIQYNDPDRLDAPPNFDDVVARLLALQPHVIIPLGTNEFVTQVMSKLENMWPAGVPRPWYLMPEGNRVQELLDLARGRPDLAGRVIGTAPGNRAGPQFSAFAGRFHAEPSNLGAAPGNLAEYAYDAMYLLAYATAISKAVAPSGPQLADGLAKTSCPGILAPPGPTGFAGLFAAAAQNQCIDYVGVSGAFDWDVEHGEARGDFDVWCLIDNGGSFGFEPPVNQYRFEAGALRDPDFDLGKPDWCKRS